MASLDTRGDTTRQGREPALAALLRTGPFDAALRAAIDARGLTLDRLRRRLEERGLTVGVTTLSYWQRGLRRPERPESLRAVTALETILALPEHSLTVLLGPPRPRGAPPRPTPAFTDIMAAPEALNTLLTELDSPAAGKLRVVAQYDAVVIGADRQLCSINTTQVVAAQSDGVDRALVIHTLDAGMDVRQVQFQAGDSCRVGRVRQDAVAGATVAEMLFDRCLRLEETHLLTYRVITHSLVEAREHVTGFRLPAGQYVLRVQFHPQALPVCGHRFRARWSSGPEAERAEMTLDSHHAVHLVAEHVGPGVTGIRWDWQ